MKTIVIDVQLAPSGRGENTMGVDIFKPSEKIKRRTAGTWFYVDENGAARHSVMRTLDHPWLKDIKAPILAQLVIKVPRENGYYWVKTKDNNWIVEWFYDDRWRSETGNRTDEYFAEIDERKIERTEQ